GCRPDRGRPCRGAWPPAPAAGREPGVYPHSKGEGMNLPQIMLAAPASGSGKTTAACALLTALRRRGLAPCAFKCGPDYIDPMFPRAALGVDSCNLDLFLTRPARLRQLYARHLTGHGAAVIEAAMGYYDGAALTDAASAWQV